MKNTQPKLSLDKTYKCSSGLGGIFRLKYLGGERKNGAMVYHFAVTSPGFEGWRLNFSEAGLSEISEY